MQSKVRSENRVYIRLGQVLPNTDVRRTAQTRSGPSQSPVGSATHVGAPNLICPRENRVQLRFGERIPYNLKRASHWPISLSQSGAYLASATHALSYKEFALQT